MEHKAASSRLRGRSVLITSGPTREHFDPIRYMTNASSGRIGFALAEAARSRGARVTVVSGPTALPRPAGCRLVRVVSAEEMRRQVLKHCRSADVVIAAAAVGDWRFGSIASRKVKKTGKAFTVSFIPTPDIISEVAKKAASRAKRPVLVGFALETARWLARAREKLRRKGLDLIVANRPDSIGAARARVALIGREGAARVLPALPKSAVAGEILGEVEKRL